MRDTELYRHLLGLESLWEVDRVELSEVYAYRTRRKLGDERAVLASPIVGYRLGPPDC